MPSAANRPGRAAAAVDRMLRRIPEAEPEAVVAAADVVALRAGHLAPADVARVRAALIDDSDARHLFASLESEPDERQMRKAIEGALSGPASLPQPRRWPWALGGGGLALALVCWVAMGWPADNLPVFELSMDPGDLNGLVYVSRGTLSISAHGRPDSTGPLRAQLFVERADGLHLSPIPVVRAADGSFTAEAPVHRWFPNHGRYTLHLALMPEAHQLAIRGDRLIDRQVGQAGVRWLSVPVLYQATLPR